MSVSFNGQTCSSVDLAFVFYRELHLSAVEPAAGMEGMMKEITVKGQNFSPNFPLSCRVGFKETTSAAFVSTTQLLCALPKFPGPGVTTIEVSNNGVDFSPSSLALEVLAHPSLHSVSPSSGPAAGGSSCVVYGLNLPVGRASAVRCSFGSTLVPALVLTSTALRCVTPLLQAGDVSLQLSLGNQMSNAMEYMAYPAMILRSIMPSKGPTSGQTVVTLHGENFGGAMSCRVVSLQASTAPA